MKPKHRRESRLKLKNQRDDASATSCPSARRRSVAVPALVSARDLENLSAEHVLGLGLVFFGQRRALSQFNTPKFPVRRTKFPVSREKFPVFQFRELTTTY